jgi:diaminopropionate ammonia-lyase
MMMELEDSLHPEKEPGIDFVFMQSGVGTWASSVVAYYRNRYPGNMPRLVTVEPLESDALLESCKQNALTKTRQSQETIMAGLNCGTPSLIAWNILKDGVDLFLSIPDIYAARAMQSLYYPFKTDRQIFAGESGAAGLAGLMALASDDALKEAKKKIGLDKTSRVLVFNTEGVTDPESFDELISQEIEL